MDKKVKIYAHRGFNSKAPENTMIAFELARQAGVDGIELDVQKTKDGKLVVIHDETLERTTDGTGWIKDLDYSYISGLDAGGWFKPEFKGERVPLFDEVLDWVKKHNMFINVELKTSEVTYPEIEEDIVNMIDKYGLKDNVLYSSFNHYSLRKLKQIDPNLQIGVLYDQPLVEPWLYAKRLGAVAIHPNFLQVNPEIIHGCKENNILINPYTVNELEDLESMIDLGVNSIITDYPDRLKKLI